MLRSVRNPLWSAAALFIVVQGMREASDILMPITVAAMMAISCSPAVRWLRQRRVPNVLAVLAVVFGIMVVLTGLGALVGASLAGFKDSLPAYRDRLTVLFEGTVAWLEAHGIRINRSELLGAADLQRATGAAAGYLVDSVTKLGGVISNTFLVVFTMILILFEGSTVPGRLRALAGNPDGDISQYARIATDVQRYLGIKTVVSGVNGLCIGAWCAVMGVDFAVLWGLVGFLLNYIPNIGFILAAMPAVLLALVQHGLGTALVLAAGYGVIGTVIGNFIEPMWLGRKLDLSVTVVFVSLVAWNWVWGPVGMLLSVPLTMIIKIMLEQSREYSFVAALLDSGEEEAARRSLTSTVPARPSGPTIPPRTPTLPPTAPRASSIPPRGFSDPVLAARPDTLRPPPLGDDRES